MAPEGTPKTTPNKKKTPTTTSQFKMFPNANSKIIPKPSQFFASKLLSSPLPTTSFFTNFVIGNGDQPAFIHPYLIQLSPSSLSLSYPSISSSSSSISQDFSPDLTISTSQASSHLVSSFSDLTVTVDFLSSDFRFLLAKGSPYVTLEVSRYLPLFLSTKSAIESFSCTKKKHKIQLKNKQTWIVYTSSELSLIKVDDFHINSSKSFSGVVRIAVIPKKKSAKSEEILDSYSTCYAVSGEATISTKFSMEYKWKTKGWGELLMLAHPLHRNLFPRCNSGIKVVDNLKYKSIDGSLVGVIGSEWKLEVHYVPISWHSRRGISEENCRDIGKALKMDVEALGSTKITTTDVYHYAMQISKAARLALIAEEVNYRDELDAITKFLKDRIVPWLGGNNRKRGFYYDEQWGGVISKQGLTNVNADHGFGLYNNHLSTLGHFVFSIAVLAKNDPEWRMKYKEQAYALVGSYMSMKKKKESKYTKLRCFDLYKLHSWTKHLGDDKPRNSENPSASIHAYYAASLLGKVYADKHLVTVGSTLASFEIEAAKTWWHVKEGGVYEGEFLKKNKMVSMNWECKRKAKKVWCTTTAENKECRLGIQVMPLMPDISDILFSDVDFVREVVDWAKPALAKKKATDDWKGLVYALEAIYDNKNALEKIRNLKCFVKDNSSSNMLWWVHSKVGRNNWCIWCRKKADKCLSCAYC